MQTLSLVGPRKVRVSPAGVASFNRSWPCSTLRASRSYWFEYDGDGNLIDSDLPESDDGAAASAMADDCRDWLDHIAPPAWAPEQEPPQ